MHYLFLAKDFFALTKPRVVSLIVFTALVGMLLAVPGLPPLGNTVLGFIGIWLAAASAAALNHLIDRRADAQMARTRNRPLPTGHITEIQALVFALALGALSMLILAGFVNVLTAVLTFFSLIGYAVIYTVYLKRATPQNIVIGGAAGAAPPVLGWTAITGSLSAEPLLLFLIIFAWTPPHFWALAIARRDDYALVDIPMLPVTHGNAFTGLQIIFYTILLVLITLLPYLIGMSGLVYLAGTLLLDSVFMYYAIRLYLSIKGQPNRYLPMRMFKYSIVYLFGLFAFLLIDHYLLFRLT
ncbi:MAG TPA: heme o synthase [Gammaproteobacteria bacterium]|nr:heme o synthase [Gammaproteobacteria bacterium]